MTRWLGAALVLAGCSDVRVVGEGGGGQGGDGAGGGGPPACVAGELRLAGEPERADYDATYYGDSGVTLVAFGAQVVMIGRERAEEGLPRPLLYSFVEPWAEWPIAAPAFAAQPRLTGDFVGLGTSLGVPYLIGYDEDGTYLVPDMRDSWLSVPLSPLPSLGIYSAANDGVIFGERNAWEGETNYRLRVTNTGSEILDALPECDEFVPRQGAIPFGSGFLAVHRGPGPEACGMLELRRFGADDVATGEVTDSFAGGYNVEYMALVPRPGGAWLLYGSYTDPDANKSEVWAVRLDGNGVRLDLEPLAVDTPHFLTVVPHGDGFALTRNGDPDGMRTMRVVTFDGDGAVVAEGEIAAQDDETRVHPTGLVSSPDESSLLVGYVFANSEQQTMEAHFARFDCAN